MVEDWLGEEVPFLLWIVNHFKTLSLIFEIDCHSPVTSIGGPPLTVGYRDGRYFSHILHHHITTKYLITTTSTITTTTTHYHYYYYSTLLLTRSPPINQTSPFPISHFPFPIPPFLISLVRLVLGKSRSQHQQ